MPDPSKFATRAEYLRASAQYWAERASEAEANHRKYADLHRAGASPVHSLVAEHHAKTAEDFRRYAQQDLRTARALAAPVERLGLLGRMLRALGGVA